MERLWSPWRLAYVTSASGGTDACIFCNTSEPGRDDLILIRGRFCFVILNLYPYNNGHLMVVPNRHVPNLQSSWVTMGHKVGALLRDEKHLAELKANAKRLGRPRAAFDVVKRSLVFIK